ncbi:hypothetical protein K0M31_016706 [Melipona bicolor]|uniref:Uncharacterized protein n=1 Tax=Melipona bicolor TaxID=60889 RepID=A0AA40FE39_9HYME|nr:hypothetical protein K0M31_016706 [Melipona bicolor]
MPIRNIPNWRLGFSQLGCPEIAPPTPRVRNTLSQKCGCNFVGDDSLIVGDALYSQIAVSQISWPMCGFLET